MVKITVDFWMAGVHYELWALGEYRKAMEAQLPILEARGPQIVYDQLVAGGLEADDAEYDLAMQDMRELTGNVLPRFMRSPFLVSLYGLYEHSVREVLAFIEDRERQPHAQLDRSKKGSFLDQADAQFTALQIPLCTDQQAWERLNMLLVLRHAVAHCNGVVAAINPKARKTILGWVEEDIGISVSRDALTFSEQFVRETYEYAAAALRDLLVRVRARYPGVPKRIGPDTK